MALLHDNLARMRSADLSHDHAAMIGLDREFHATLAAASHNTIMADFLGNLQDRALRFWFVSLKVPSHAARIYEQHSAIFEAVANHDPDGAEAAMRYHIEEFRNNVSRQI